MAIHHLTPPVRGGERPRLASTQAGPVTQAIRAMRAAETETVSVLSGRSTSPKLTTKSETISLLPVDLDRQRIQDLRRRIAERIEADLALLDALDGNCDIEDHDPAGGDVCDEPHDPEEDGNDHEQRVYVTGFDGTNYNRGRA